MKDTIKVNIYIEEKNKKKEIIQKVLAPDNISMKGVAINICKVSGLLKIELFSAFSKINTLKNTFDDLMRCLILTRKIIDIAREDQLK